VGCVQKPFRNLAEKPLSVCIICSLGCDFALGGKLMAIHCASHGALKIMFEDVPCLVPTAFDSCVLCGETPEGKPEARPLLYLPREP
jgi:hypothetical protein